MSSNNNKKSFKKALIGAFEIYAIILLLVSLVYLGIPDSKKGSYDDGRKKACFSNVRVLENAVEMYNMDKKDQISEFNDDVVEILINEKYLKAKPNPPITKCEYKGNNLNKGGVVYCKYHGYYAETNDSEYKREMEQKEREKRLNKIKKQAGILLLCAIPSIIYVLLSL